MRMSLTFSTFCAQPDVLMVLDLRWDFPLGCQFSPTPPPILQLSLVISTNLYLYSVRNKAIIIIGAYKDPNRKTTSTFWHYYDNINFYL